jgi:hypothetical protein
MHHIINWGAVIMQGKKPIAFYSRKLNTDQSSIQPVREAENCYQLLKTTSCKEYKNILLGYPMIVFTYHKTNTFNGLKVNSSDRVLHTCWLLLLKHSLFMFHLSNMSNCKEAEDTQ